jgi:hypothetical protein
MIDYTMRFVTTRGQVTEYLESCADDTIAVEKAGELGRCRTALSTFGRKTAALRW